MEKWSKRILPSMKDNIKELIYSNAKIVEEALKDYIKLENSSKLLKAMEYSLLAGGKRIRPFIVLEVYKAFAKENFDIRKALPFACALEMIHTYSLIHDDLPCMDNDDFRRGKLTNHKVFGEAEALLAGDTLLTYAFEVAASNSFVSDKSVRLAIFCLSRCAGAFGMAGGQMIDIGNDTLDTYDKLKSMHIMKTGALMRCAALLGYYAYTDNPNFDTEQNLESFANKLGVAFQVRDDILDVVSSVEDLGKPIGSDDKNNKTTVFSFMSLDEAEKEVEALTSEAVLSLEKCLGNDSKVLKELANYMVERKN